MASLPLSMPNLIMWHPARFMSASISGSTRSARPLAIHEKSRFSDRIRSQMSTTRWRTAVNVSSRKNTSRYPMPSSMCNSSITLSADRYRTRLP